MHIKRSLLTTIFALLMASTYASVLAETTVSVVNDIRQKLDPDLHLDDALLASFMDQLSGRFIVKVNGTAINPGEEKTVTFKENECEISFEFEPTNAQSVSKVRLTGNLKRVVAIASFLNSLGMKIGLVTSSATNGNRVYFTYTVTEESVMSLGDILIDRIATWACAAPDIEIDVDGMHII